MSHSDDPPSTSTVWVDGVVPALVVDGVRVRRNDSENGSIPLGLGGSDLDSESGPTRDEGPTTPLGSQVLVTTRRRRVGDFGCEQFEGFLL